MVSNEEFMAQLAERLHAAFGPKIAIYAAEHAGLAVHFSGGKRGKFTNAHGIEPSDLSTSEVIKKAHEFAKTHAADILLHHASGEHVGLGGMVVYFTPYRHVPTKLIGRRMFERG